MNRDNAHRQFPIVKPILSLVLPLKGRKLNRKFPLRGSKSVVPPSLTN